MESERKRLDEERQNEIIKFEASRQEEIKREEEIRNRPILIFEQINTEKGNIWAIKNVGIAVAMNIYVIKRRDKNLMSKQDENGYYHEVELDDSEMDNEFIEDVETFSAILPTEYKKIENGYNHKFLFALYNDILGNDILSMKNRLGNRIYTKPSDVNQIYREFEEYNELLFCREQEDDEWNEDLGLN